MAPRHFLLVAGVAAGANFISDRRGDAQPVTPPTTKPPLVMANARPCDGLRDLMIDTVVHHTLVGYSPYQQKNYHRHPVRRQGRPDTGVNPKRRRKAASPMRSEPSHGDDAFSSGQGSYSEQARLADPHHTTTNVQEQGVDESDIVKTDGKYVYTVHATSS